jgi:hypothetical protein
MKMKALPFFETSLTIYQSTRRYITGDMNIPLVFSRNQIPDQANIYFELLKSRTGARGGVVVKALRYKPAGRGFDSR